MQLNEIYNRPLVRLIAVLLCIFGAVFVVYYHALSADFIFDDLAMIPDNAQNLLPYAKLSEYFTTGVWNHSNISYADGSLYRPMWMVWEFFMYHLAGEEPSIWHFSNLLLHGINGLLLFVVVGKWYPNTGNAVRLAVAMLFVLHPATSQSVAWISASPDLVMVFWLACSMLAYISFRQSTSIFYFCLSVFCFTLALLTKEVAIVFPVVLIFYDLERKEQWRRFPWREYVVFFLVTASYLLIRKSILQGVLTGGPQSSWSFKVDSIARLIDYAATYLRILAVPWELPFSNRHIPGGVTNLFDYFVALAAVIAAVFYFIRSNKSRKTLALVFGSLCIPLLLALYDKGSFSVRFLYLPVFALAISLTPFVEFLLKRPFGKGLTLTLLLAFATITSFKEVPGWHNQAAWAEMMLKYDPSSDKNWGILVQEQVELGDMSSAVATYQESLKHVSDTSLMANTLEVIAFAYAQKGDYSMSIPFYQKMVEISGYAYLGWTGIGNSLWALNKLNEASDAYHKAILDQSDHFDALYNYSILNKKLNRLNEVYWAAEKIMALPPDKVPANIRESTQQFIRQYRG